MLTDIIIIYLMGIAVGIFYWLPARRTRTATRVNFQYTTNPAHATAPPMDTDQNQPTTPRSREGGVSKGKVTNQPPPQQ